MKITAKQKLVLIGDSITHFWGGEPDAGGTGNRGRESWAALFGDRSTDGLAVFLVDQHHVGEYGARVEVEPRLVLEEDVGSDHVGRRPGSVTGE